MKRSATFTGLILLFTLSLSFGLSLPLKVKDGAGIARVNVPLMNGVPMPEGKFQVADLSKLTVLDSVTRAFVPSAYRVLSKWPDGTVKFIAVMFQATVAANATTTYLLTDANYGNAVAGLSASMAAGVVTVNTGVLRFTVKASAFNVIDEAWVDLTGAQNYDNAHKVLAAGNTSYTSAAGTSTAGRPDTLSIVYQNSEQVCIRASLTTADEKQNFVFHVTAFRGKPYVKITHNWYYNMFVSDEIPSFTDLTLAFKSLVSGSVTATFSQDATGKTTADAQMDVSLASGETATETYSTANAYTIKKGATTLVSGTGQNLGSGGTKKMGWVHLTNGTIGIGGGMRNFWEMAPKHLEVKGDGTLELGLFSRYSTTIQIPWYGGFGRTHSTFVSFGTDVNMTKEAFYSVAQPLMAIPPAVWMCGMTKSFGPGMVHGDKTLFAADAATQAKYQSFFNVYKANISTHGYNAYKTPITSPFMGTTDLHNFISYGDNVEPVNSTCTMNQQHFANNYYDMAWLAAECYAMNADYTYALFGLDRALHTADMDHNQTNGDCKGCPGVQQFYSYQTCSAQDWGNSNHWKTRGIFYWYFIFGDPILKELGVRITVFPIQGFTNSDQPRGTGHAILGLTAAYEATGDSAYIIRARQYYAQGSGNSMDFLAQNVTATNPNWQTNIAGEGMAYHLTYDRNWQHGKDMLVTWARQLVQNPTFLGDNPMTAFAIWGLEGFNMAIQYGPNQAYKDSVKNRGKALFDTLLASAPAAQGRQKVQVEEFKCPPQFLKNLVLDPNYLTALFPNYTDAVEKSAPKSTGGNLFLSASPNPFNPEVTLTAIVPVYGMTQGFTLKVYDVAGREVADLTANVRNGQTVWNAARMPSGIYLVKFTAGKESQVKQITLLK